MTKHILFCCALFATSVSASADPMKNWEPVAADALPSLAPEGKLADFELALRRQIDNCREFRQGRYTICKSESGLVTLVCHEPTLNKMRELVKTSKSWAALYEKSKKVFDWYRYTGGAESGQVLFTAYNAPAFEASLTPSERFRYPLYSRPSDLIDLRNDDGKIIWRKKLPDGTVGMYDDRKTIDVDKSLAGKGLEVAYMDQPLDVMRLQGEGSGVLRFKESDGKVREVGANYAGQNGRPQVSISKYLRAKGVDPKYYSYSGQKKYFAEHPEELWPALVTNPSYVFFSVTDEPPCGTAHVHLTPGHTLAVDPTHLPLGSLVLIDTYRPVRNAGAASEELVSRRRFTRFALAQDTGGPIIGAHVDTYWGSDDDAQYLSNSMSENGTMFFPRLKTTRADRDARE